MNSNRSFIPVTLTIACIALALGLSVGYYTSQFEGMKNREDLSKRIQTLSWDSEFIPIQGSPAKGSIHPKATLVVFVDFTAPAFVKFHQEFLEHAFQVHGDDIAVVYKQMPLQNNPDAMFRAQAAVAAQRQDAFWPMADALVHHASKPFSPHVATQLAAQLGLDLDQFQRDFNDRKLRESIRRDIALADKLHLQAAPAIFINQRAVSTPFGLSQDALMNALNAEIAQYNAITSQPMFPYYLSSILNQNIDDALNRHDDAGRPERGSEHFLVTIVEYSDYECPFCARVEPTLDRILKTYPDSVRLVFSHHPLPMHRNAKLAAYAAFAADQQGKFWEMHEWLFKNQRSLSEKAILERAQSMGLNLARFKADLQSPEAEAVVRKHLEDAESWGITGTPSFLVNGRAITGAQPFEKFEAQIEKALQSARALSEKTGLTDEALYREILKTAPKPEPATDPARVFIETSNAHAIGNPNALVTIIEFTDFECPYCARANETLQQIFKKYPDDVRLVFKNYPLSFHAHADAAHRAAEAAARQGKFWEMYALLFQNQKSLENDDLDRYAAQIGLDLAQFHADMNADEVKNRVIADTAAGSDAGVSGTPHFLVNGTPISGAQPIEVFQDVIERERTLAAQMRDEGTPIDQIYAALVGRENPKPTPESQPSPPTPVVLEPGNSFFEGSPNAPVTLYFFVDLGCPFSAQMMPILDEIRASYGDQIRIIYKMLPIAMHKNSQLAAEAVLAAGAQHKFREMGEILFQNRHAHARDQLLQYARQLSLDMVAFENDLSTHRYEPQILHEIEQANVIGFEGTPSFVLNGKPIRGIQSIASLKKEIDQALAIVKQ